MADSKPERFKISGWLVNRISKDPDVWEVVKPGRKLWYGILNGKMTSVYPNGRRRRIAQQQNVPPDVFSEIRKIIS